MNKKEVALSERERKILVATLSLAEDKNFGHKTLADFLEEKERTVRFNLRIIAAKGFLKYRGWKKNQDIYCLSDSGYALALSLKDKPKPSVLVIEEETKHLGIPTTQKKTKVSPSPQSFDTSSETSASSGIKVLSSEVNASYEQKDKKKLEFLQ